VKVLAGMKQSIGRPYFEIDVNFQSFTEKMKIGFILVNFLDKRVVFLTSRGSKNI